MKRNKELQARRRDASPRTSGRNTGKRNDGKRHQSKSYESRALRNSIEEIYLGHAYRGAASVEDAAKVALLAHEGIEYQPLRTSQVKVSSDFSVKDSNMEVDDGIAKILMGGTNSDEFQGVRVTGPVARLEFDDGLTRSGSDYSYQEWVVFARNPNKRWVVPYDKVQAAKAAGFLVLRNGPEFQPERVTSRCLEQIVNAAIAAGGKVRRRLTTREEKDGVC